MQLYSKYRHPLNIVCLIATDLLAFYASLFLAFYTRTFLGTIFEEVGNLAFPFFYFWRFWWMPLTTIIFLAYEKLYTKRLPFGDEARDIVKALTISLVVILANVTLGKLSEHMSRLTLLLMFGYGLFIFPATRVFAKKLMYYLGIWKENVIILGAGRAGTETARGLHGETHLGYNIVGFLDDDPEKIGTRIKAGARELKVFGRIRSFRKFVNLLDISTVIIAIPSFPPEKLSALTSDVQKDTRQVLVVPDLKGIALINTELQHLFLQQLFLLKINNNLKSVLNRFIKRAFDLAVSIMLLPFLLPVIAAISLFIRLDSPGPVIFTQERLGRNRSTFRCYKFRTMHVDGDRLLGAYLDENPDAREEWIRFKKLKTFDPRVTKAGSFLRKTSLDELPQIFNILKGEMSLVSPRPYLPREIEDMKGYIDTILLTTPGITGLWQIQGRNELSFEDRLKLDAWYVLNWSLWFDIVILFKTVRVVLKREGAY